MKETIALIIAIIGLFGSIMTIFINNIYQKKTELRKIKESQYIDFLSYLAKARVANDQEIYSYNLTLSEKVQTIYLIGNKKVQESLESFLEVFKKKTDKEKQNELYANLILEMKKDLYGNRKGKKSLYRIKFTVFGSKD